MASDSDDQLQIRFNEELSKLVTSKGANSGFMNREQYLNTIEILKEAKATKSKTAKQYRRIKRYAIYSVGGIEKLITPVTANEVAFKFFATNEEIFDIVHEAHVSIGHGGRHRMVEKIKKKYKNITQEIISIYLSLCTPCQMKLTNAKKEKAIRNTTPPIALAPDEYLNVNNNVDSEMNSRCQVELIDMQSCPDGPYKFILVYQDHQTKFVQLRPLRTKTAIEVAKNVLDIFCIFGAPMILYSDNGREFCNHLLDQLICLWPGLKLVSGSPRLTPSQSNIERTHQNVENMLRTWMVANNNKSWSEGLNLAQITKNRSYHDSLKRSPYKAMFGIDLKFGLSSSSLPQERVQNIHTEEELRNIIREITLDKNYQKEDIEDTEVEREYIFLSNNFDTEGDASEMNHTIKMSPRDSESEETIESDHNEDTNENYVQIINAPNLCGINAISSMTIGNPDQDSELYQSANETSVISDIYTRNPLSISKRKLSLDEITSDKKSLREIVREQSSSGSEEFQKCNCKIKCYTKKCRCRARNILCNSKCHSSMACSNK